MRKNHDIIDIYCRVKVETEKAYLICDGTKEEWIPKSLCEFEQDLTKKGNFGTLQLSEQLAFEKGLI